MTHKGLLLLKELQELAIGLQKGNKLLMRQKGGILICQFVMGGLVRHLAEVRSELLIEALLQKGMGGIVEGKHYHAFLHGFKAMALHVKSQWLLHELELEQHEASGDYLRAFVA